MPDTLVETLDPLPTLVEASILGRPGWIPSEIRENWNPDPYAYQTEEESMPDREGWLTLAEMGLKIKAIGQRIIFNDAIMNEILFDSSHLLAALAEERQARLEEQQAQQEVNQALLEERQARQEDRQNVALAMWHKGLAIEMIAEVTGLSETELALLIKESRGD